MKKNIKKQLITFFLTIAIFSTAIPSTNVNPEETQSIRSMSSDEDRPYIIF